MLNECFDSLISITPKFFTKIFNPLRKPNTGGWTSKTKRLDFKSPESVVAPVFRARFVNHWQTARIEELAFTINTLEAGTLIWKYDVDEYDESEARMKLDSLSSPEEKKLWVEHIFAWKEKIVILKDDLELINHSLKPNVFFSQQDGNIRALKEIDSGDEMLIDYQQLGSYPEFYLKMMEEVGSWFSSRIQSNQRD